MGRGVACVVLAILALAPSSAFAQQPAITMQASATRVRSGSQVTLSGQATDAPSGSQVALTQATYPYKSSSPVSTATPDASGNFSFKVSPAIDTKYQVAITGTSAQASVQIAVTGRLVIRVKALPLGRAGITVHVHHPSSLHWGKRPVQWSFAEGQSSHFKTGSPTKTRNLSPTLTSLYTTVALPAGHFSWRACFHATDDQALVNKQKPPGCSGRGYQGHGNLPFGYPSLAAIHRAESYLNRRGGHTALAVVTTEGRESGIRIHDRVNPG